MANSCQQSLGGKPSNLGTSTIGFRFHTNDEELEELISDRSSMSIETLNEADLVGKPSSPISDSPKSLKCDLEKREPVGDAVKDHWNILGRKSIVDSNYESPFSNPIETWRKLNEIKGKITKTVEEKISEMKMDRNAFSKPSRSKLLSSKENSSVSDSEDTSECSRFSEHWKDAEDLNLSSKEALSKNLDVLSTTLETAVENVKIEIESIKTEEELRNRKGSKFSDKFLEAKEASSRNRRDSSLDTSVSEDVESGVEAEENLGPIESCSIALSGNTDARVTGGGRLPPWGGGHFRLSAIYSFSSMILSQAYTFILLFGFGIFFFLPLSDFSKGFLVCLLMIIFWKKIEHRMRAVKPSNLKQNLCGPGFKSLPPLRVPKSPTVTGIWFNEYEKEFYNPDYYSVTETVPAFVELDNNLLKISRPKEKIQRRATYDEPEYKLTFISHRVFDISGCNVYLLPEGLTRKRLYSKKYPIVIILRPDSLISMMKKKKEGDGKDMVEVDVKNFVSHDSPRNHCKLILFARCDRQKEEWYRRIISATKCSCSTQPKNEDSKKDLDDSSKDQSNSFENLLFDEANIEEYLHYMAIFVDKAVIRPDIISAKPTSRWYKKLKSKRKDTRVHEEIVEELKTANNEDKNVHTSQTSVESDYDPEGRCSIYPSFQVQWLNAFVNRILYDVFRSPYWLSKIHSKVQRKLNSIRLPYYVEEIELTEMNLGKMGPVFHRVSPPFLDERGLWFDIDTTFDGLIKLSIQTHLNLLKLQKGIEEEYGNKSEKGKKKNIPKENLTRRNSKEKAKEYVNSKNKNSEDVPSTSNPISVETNVKEVSLTKIDEESLDHKTLEALEIIEELAEIVVKESIYAIKEAASKEAPPKPVEAGKSSSAIYDSEVEDSPESSEEELEEIEEEKSDELEASAEVKEPVDVSELPKRYPRNRRSSKRLFRVFENVAQSKYFQSVAHSKYVQKAMAGFSATKLKLTVELKSLSGVLSVNVPPPPSDRIWYGFRDMPKVTVSTYPKVGDKPVRLGQIKSYLHKKIMHEIKAKMVLPNMICMLCPAIAREELKSAFVNVPLFKTENLCGKKLMVVPNMIDFVLPTSSLETSSSSLLSEQQDLDDQEPTPSD